MKNEIYYGKAGSGKSKRFKEMIEYLSGWDSEDKNNKLIMFGTEAPGLNKFKVYNLGAEYNYKEILKDDYVFFLISDTCDPYFNIEHTKKILKTLGEKLENYNKEIYILMDQANVLLYGKIDFELLFNSDNVNIYLFLQDLKMVKEIYTSQYSNFISHFNVICMDDFSGELRVRFPKSLHKNLKIRADIEGISLNQYIIYALTRAIEKDNYLGVSLK